MKKSIATKIAVLGAIGVMTMASATAAFACDGMGTYGTQASAQTSVCQTYYVTGTTYYMALRNAPSYSANNEIGKYHNGDAVTVTDKSSGRYWLVTVNGQVGYMDSYYLTSNQSNVKGAPSGSVVGTTKTVKVAKNYLALRNYPSYSRSNEIAQLYTGDKVTVVSTNNGSQYWTVKTASGLQGYVNANYLV